jgi:glycosyltransferase involved in cell wall biosynthesis
MEARLSEMSPKRRAMRLVMTLLVRNEEDIVRANVAYHLAAGVDFIIATDNGSTDGTVEILEEYQRAGTLRLLHEPADDYSQWRWVTRMARLAHDEHGADWVINNDADEFWWPLRGDLKAALSQVEGSAGTVVAPRSNFVPRPESGQPFFERMIWRERVSLNSVGMPLPPKVCHRARPDVEVEQGNHAARAAGLGPAAAVQPFLIFHFPLRSFAQFARKIETGGAAYARNTELPPEVGATWRHLYAEWQAGRLAKYYDAQVIPDDVLAARLQTNDLLVDTRVRDFMRSQQFDGVE